MNCYFKNFIKLLSYACFYFVYSFTLSGCNFYDGNSKLKLHPAVNKVYNYSLIKTSSAELPYNGITHTKYDTIRLDFSCKSLANTTALLLSALSILILNGTAR